MAYHILVVDDNEMNLSLIGRILELEGYSVETVHEGAEAFEAINRQAPDLAILDVMMPDIDGYSLCKKLRLEKNASDIPIVMLTAMNSEIERTRALEAGANDIWSKPFDLDMFRKWIRDTLENSGQHQAPLKTGDQEK